jgi:hypothetical protein
MAEKKEDKEKGYYGNLRGQYCPYHEGGTASQCAECGEKGF